MNDKPALYPDDAKDAARYRYLVRNKNWHLLKLMANDSRPAKEAAQLLDDCIDRCLESEAEIMRRQRER